MNDPYVITLFAIVIYLLIRTRHKFILYTLIAAIYVTIGYKYVMKFLSSLNVGPIMAFLIIFGPIVIYIAYAFWEKERAGEKKTTPPSIEVLIERSRTNIIFWSCIVIFNLAWALLKK